MPPVQITKPDSLLMIFTSPDFPNPWAFSCNDKRPRKIAIFFMTVIYPFPGDSTNVLLMLPTMLANIDLVESFDTIFMVILAIALLVIMYTISLIHNKLRLIENDVQNLQNEQTVLSDELEFVAKIKTEKEAS